jgi:hypothetical protein
MRALDLSLANWWLRFEDNSESNGSFESFITFWAKTD